MFFWVGHAIVMGIRGKNVAIGGYSKGPAEQRREYLLSSIFFVGFSGALSWSIYVFAEEILYSVLVGGGLTLIFLPMLWISMKMTPKPPAEGFSSDKEALQWESESFDLISKKFDKPMELLVRLFLVSLAFAMVAILMRFIAALIKG